jgi:hypothetical protein
LKPFYLLLIAVALLAEDKPKPMISAENRAAYWKSRTAVADANATVAQASAAKSAADAALKDAVAKLTKDCDVWTPQMDQATNEPICVEPPHASSKTPEK